MTMPRYAIAGSGRWAELMGKILAQEPGGASVLTGLRQTAGESCSDYRARLRRRLREVAANIVWLAVPPGPHVGLMIEAAIAVDADVVVEKPWTDECGNAGELAALAEAAGRLVAVHFEFCFLDAILAWREERQILVDAIFEGAFMISKSNRLDLPAIQNLGSHLMAIHHFAVPQAAIGLLDCGYELPDRRMVRLTRRESPPLEIDFTESTEPVIQRFIAALAGARDSGVFELDLRFADRVHRSLCMQPISFTARPCQTND